MATDNDALVCDFAETYHVLAYKTLPARLAATLAAGLSDNSRSKRALAGAPCSVETTLLALAVDRLSDLVWMQTDDARKGKNRPESICRKMLGKEHEKTNGDVMMFATGSEFTDAWKKINGGE